MVNANHADGENAPPPGEIEETAADWQVSVRFSPGVLTAGMDPIGFVRYLRTFCELQRVKVLEDALPEADLVDAETCYLAFQMDLRTREPRSRIEGAFEFVREDCELEITEVRSEPQREPAIASAPSRAFVDGYAGESGQQIEGAGVGVPQAPIQGRSKREGAPDANVLSRSVRVDAGKLDYLITRIGELIIAAAGVNLLARRGGNSELEERTSTLAAWWSKFEKARCS